MTEALASQLGVALFIIREDHHIAGWVLFYLSFPVFFSPAVRWLWDSPTHYFLFKNLPSRKKELHTYLIIIRHGRDCDHTLGEDEELWAQEGEVTRGHS
jgi:hypothetical protein